MESKRRTSTPKSTQKSQSHSKSKNKKGISSAMRDSKTKVNLDVAVVVVAQTKKKSGQHLMKKKIEELKTPEIIIKVNYKGKRISIPIATCDDKNLHDTVMPHIVRFEREILRMHAVK
jgi:hypothetical protein